MTISAKIIEDSIAPNARRLTTFELKYPRFIHAEFMTHRQFSRNASSSRAIPVERQIEAIIEDTAMPIHWGMNQSGMQAEQETDALISLPTETGGCADFTAQEAWLEARDRAIEVARGFVASGYHKQVVNRILEPFSHINVVMTTTQLDNWFGLRSHKDAQPEIKALADAMQVVFDESTPRQLGQGDWHLPYITEMERMQAYGAVTEDADGNEVPAINDLVRASVARCARVSYKTHDGKTPTLEQDWALYERLVGSQPLHASPAEHQATPDSVIWNAAELKDWANPHLHGNLQGGWIQFRKTLPFECIDNHQDTLNNFD